METQRARLREMTNAFSLFRCPISGSPALALELVCLGFECGGLGFEILSMLEH
jgi:hypothetical protein